MPNSKPCSRTSTSDGRPRLGAILTGVGLSLAPAAWANGRYPLSGQIAVDPSDSTHIVARATYGLLQSTDSGKAWRWICETAVGYEDKTDPFIAIGASGTIVAATTQGLSVSPDRGCTWTRPPGPIGSLPSFDLVVARDNPAHMMALVLDAEGEHLRLAGSQDGGLTWAYQGTPLPADFAGLTLEWAPSDENRVYLSGKAGPARNQNVLQRSNDAGATWVQLALDPSDVAGDFIGAVDPADPDRLFVRRNRDGEQALLVSPDAGKSWQVVFQTEGNLFGFAMSPDGKQIALGVVGKGAGIWTADSHALQFQQRNPVGARCLTWAKDALYVCADEDDPAAHLTVGVSTDGGSTVTALHHRKDLTPLQCPVGTRTGNECPKYWAQTSYLLGIDQPGVADASGTQPAVPKKSSGLCNSTPVAEPGPWLALLGLAMLAVRRRRPMA
jgi:MYXO-CTERM domain-containing protein